MDLSSPTLEVIQVEGVQTVVSLAGGGYPYPAEVSLAGGAGDPYPAAEVLAGSSPYP